MGISGTCMKVGRQEPRRRGFIAVHLIMAIASPLPFSLLVPSISWAQAPLTPVLGLSGTSLDFGEIVVGDCEIDSITVFNAAEDSTSILEITDLQVGGPFSFSSVPSLPIQLRGDGSMLAIGLRFCPQAHGQHAQSLRITTQGTNTPITSVSLTGTAFVLPVCNAGGPYSGYVGAQIQFDASGSQAPGGYIASYEWSFDDSTFAQGPIVTHAFGSMGMFNVALRLTDDHGHNSQCDVEADVRMQDISGFEPQDFLDHHRIVLQGTVLNSTLIGYHTRLDIHCDEYLSGTGAEVVSIIIHAADTDSFTTISFDHRPGPATFRVPKPGDSAIFWIPHRQRSAHIKGRSEIWAIEGDSLPGLGMSLEAGKAAIQAAVTSFDLGRQRLLAGYAVVTSSSQGAPEPCGSDDAFYCHRVTIERQLFGKALPSTLLVKAPARYEQLIQYYWRTTQGLLFLRTVEPPNIVHPTHPIFGFFPKHEDGFIVGYRLVEGEEAASVAPVVMPLNEVVQ